MPALSFRRVRFSKDADVWLRTLAGRTQLTPNLLCRFALSTSLMEGGVADPGRYPEDSERVIGRAVLLGGLDEAFQSLLAQRLAEDGVKTDNMSAHLRAHIHRGIDLLSKRLRTLSDLEGLLPRPDAKR